MTTLTERLKAVLKPKPYNPSAESTDLRRLADSFNASGAALENARLAELHAALLEAVELVLHYSDQGDSLAEDVESELKYAIERAEESGTKP